MSQILNLKKKITKKKLLVSKLPFNLNHKIENKKNEISNRNCFKCLCTWCMKHLKPAQLNRQEEISPLGTRNISLSQLKQERNVISTKQH